MKPEEIIAWRTKYKISQKALADKAGLTPASMSAIETGKSTPRHTTVVRLKKAMDDFENSLLVVYSLGGSHDTFKKGEFRSPDINAVVMFLSETLNMFHRLPRDVDLDIGGLRKLASNIHGQTYHALASQLSKEGFEQIIAPFGYKEKPSEFKQPEQEDYSTVHEKQKDFKIQ